MAEEPSLPRLPAAATDQPQRRFVNAHRKRGRNDLYEANASSSLFNSSDPAVFSSDDDPGLDNYVEGRRKKRYIGSWFQQQPTSSDSTFGEANPAPRPLKRTLTRQFDSGVFLGSDGTDNEEILEELGTAPRSKLPQLEHRSIERVSNAELEARETVRRCIEQCSERIDLWAMGLDEISDETIEPLANFTCIPLVTKDVAFEQRDPELEIYLAMNRLRWIPKSIFDLSHLTILSLRGNKLRELPPAIAQLKNLEQLNVSLNRLRHLPAELLDLLQPGGKLRKLVLHPNPYDQPETPFQRALMTDQDDPDAHFLTIHLGRSPLQLSDSRGKVFSGFRLPTGDMSERVAVDSTGAAPRSSSRVPSLLEVALRTCYNSSHLPELEHYIPDDLSPLRQLLARATEQKRSGGLLCTKCRRLLVMPTVEWLEWREVCAYGDETGDGPSLRMAVSLSLTCGEIAVPFKHRGCSADCGPCRDGEQAT
ncbi:hypothetical protein HIM_05779 [Hirsutella minnesotensis 3608]|uniref:Glucose-repressible alcohol dehydrogenase transcriptional effector n=1 Tax=Hirsutella minnesotensis 3608 TaxID=1043627 RepID=A0A0F7ZP47_9HYPO|nr:hypothetical protein HIM_05779 [Hirsutella minnesotensis 3608]